MPFRACSEAVLPPHLIDGCLSFAANCCRMLQMNKTLTPPTKPPRVSVPVTEEVLEIFQRLAKAGNMSTGRAMAEWLADTSEAAELMASTMERARAAPKLITAELHAMMLGMADQTKELADKYSKFKGPLTGTVAVPGSVAGERDGSSHRPPSGNTGGKGTKNHSKDTSAHKVKTHKTPEIAKTHKGLK